MPGITLCQTGSDTLAFLQKGKNRELIRSIHSSKKKHLKESFSSVLGPGIVVTLKILMRMPFSNKLHFMK